MKDKIYAMIPARIGSQRLKFKNLALLNNKPIIYYAINAAKQSKCFDKIFIPKYLDKTLLTFPSIKI